MSATGATSSDVVERIEVPARAGRFARVRKGQLVRVIDVEGGQVVDLFAWADAHEHLSAQHTRAVLDRLFPAVGEAFQTNRRRPILTFLRDDTPGVHDMLIAACDAERYEGLGVRGHHASCSENFRAAMVEAGHGDPGFTPQSVNLFMAIPVDAEGRLSWDPATTAAGDSVTLRAEMDCTVIVSACPQDIVPINNLRPTSAALEVLDHGDLTDV